MASTAKTLEAEKACSPFANPMLDSTVGRPPISSTPTSTAKTVVLFHAPCPDGAFAALAAWLHFGGESSSSSEKEVKFVPHRVYEALEVPPSTSYSSALPPSPSAPASSPSSPLSGLSSKDTVYLLDYSGPAGFPQALAKVAGRVVVLDHHKTAAEQLSKVIEEKAWLKEDNGEGKGGTATDLRNLEVLIDQGRSGATISAAHFDPPLSEGLRRAFAAIQDGDLWRWRLPGSRAFYAGLHSSGILDEKVTKTPQEMLSKLSRLDWEETVARGEGEVEERDRAVAAEAARAFEVELRAPERRGPPSSSSSAAAAAAAAAAASIVSFGRALAVEVEPDQAGLRSLLGNVLAARAKEKKEKEGDGKGMRSVGVVAYREPGMKPDPSSSSEDLIKISLRSIGEDEDTTPVSQAHGGGGHRNASSFLMPAKDFAKWKEVV